MLYAAAIVHPDQSVLASAQDKADERVHLGTAPGNQRTDKSLYRDYIPDQSTRLALLGGRYMVNLEEAGAWNQNGSA